MIFRHTPETPIIRPLAVLGIFLVFSGFPVSAQDAPGIACVSCLVLDVPLEAIRSLPAEPGSLDGLQVAVRWQPGGHDAADSTLDAALERLTAAGARAGIVMADQPSDRAAADALSQLAGGARFALIDPPAGPDLAARVFARAPS